MYFYTLLPTLLYGAIRLDTINTMLTSYQSVQTGIWPLDVATSRWCISFVKSWNLSLAYSIQKSFPFSTTNFNLPFLHFFNEISQNLVLLCIWTDWQSWYTDKSRRSEVSFKANLFATCLINTMPSLPLFYLSLPASCFVVCFHKQSTPGTSQWQGLSRGSRTVGSKVVVLCSVYLTATSWIIAGW